MSERKTILFIGDSLTEWYDWQGRFPNFSVINLGISGETVEGLGSRINRIVRSVKTADLIFLMTGINNIAMEDYGITEIYRDIVKELASAYSGALIVVQSVLPVNLDWIDNEDIVRINRTLEKIANEFEGKYLDVYRRFINTDGSPVLTCLLEDGVHLSDAGYEVWADEVEVFLNGKWRQYVTGQR